LPDSGSRSPSGNIPAIEKQPDQAQDAKKLGWVDSDFHEPGFFYKLANSLIFEIQVILMHSII
jgi:hypothetical protein